ncbi:MAG: hypothetical protein K2X11_01750 [Acetobacteraceae bacterium]|nr:hypothetical protein [Acetobacteraceae bacterium]
MATRRTLLATASAGLWLSLADGWLRPVRAAAPLDPWNQAAAAAPADPRLRALLWAVLAPNPHNRQPWLIRLDGDDALTLVFDRERRLPVTDPFDRQLTIGLGCFLELLRLAAAQQGFAAAMTPFPEGSDARALDARPVARVVFGPGGQPDPLFAAAPHRRSAKLPFDMTRPVTTAEEAALRGALLDAASFGAEREAGGVATLRDLAWRAWVIEAGTPAAHLESVDLMRLGTPAVAAQPDGIPVWGPQLDPMIARGELTRAAMLPGGPGHRVMFDRYRPMIAATPAFVWLATPGNTRGEQLAAGRDWLRLNLAATAAGLALHPVSQALQEYPEMAGPFREAQARLGGGRQAQMLGRLGVAMAAAPPTPRWPLESRILRG